MFHGLEINLSVIIIHHIIHATTLKKPKSCVPYGMLLTRVFEKFNIDLEKENFDTVCTEFLPKNIARMKKSPSIEIPKPNTTPDEAKTTLKRKREDKGKAPMDELLDAIIQETHEDALIPNTDVPENQASEKFDQASNSVLDLNSLFISHSSKHMVLDVAKFRDWFIADYCKRFGVTPPCPTFGTSSFSLLLPNLRHTLFFQS